MALAYGDVRDIYDSLKDAGVVTKSLPDWSDEMNKVTESDLYSAGLHDNLIKQASYSIDKALKSSGLVDVGREFGRSVGAEFGVPEAGARVGAGIPRSVVNFAPLLVPGAGWGAAAARLGLVGALSGAETYEQTGSPAAGVISGATAAALPKVADIGEQQVLKYLGGRLVKGPLTDATGNVLESVKRYFPETLGQRAAAFGTGQALGATAIGGSQALESVAQGETPESPFTVENLLNLTLGQAPFAALHLASGVRGKPADNLQAAVDASSRLMEDRQTREALAQRAPIEKIPVVSTPDEVSPSVITEINTRLSQIRGEQVKVETDPTLTPEQRVERANLLMNQEAELARSKEEVMGTTVFGDALRPDNDRTEVLGKQLATNKNGTWRAVHVSDDESNPSDLRGKVVSYSTAYEPNPTFGLQTQETGVAKYSLPSNQWRTIRSIDEWRGKKPADVTQPELPQQATEPTREQMFGHIRDLQDAETAARFAETPTQLQQAVTRINDVKEQVGLPPTNDRTLRKVAATVDKSGLVEPGEVVRTAVKVEAASAQRKLRQIEREVPPLSEEEAAHVSAVMGGEGFSVQTMDKLSHAASGDVETKPISDIVSDTTAAAIRTPQVREAFDKWPSKLGTTFPQDMQDALDLVENFGSLTKVPLKEAANLLNEARGTRVWDAAGIQEFLDRPHVRVLADRLEQGLRNVVSRGPVSKQSTVYGVKDLGYVKQSDITKIEKGAAWPDDITPTINDQARVGDTITFTKDGKEVSGQVGSVATESAHNQLIHGEEPFVPQTPKDANVMNQMGVAQGGKGLLSYLQRSDNTFVKALADDLAKFPESLDRITPRMAKMDGIGYARRNNQRQVDIALGHGLIDALPTEREFTVAHELVHGMTLAELDNPSKQGVVTKLNDLRERVIEQLPPDLRKLYDKAVRTNFIDRYSAGVAPFNEVTDDFSKGEIIYGLLGNDEFVSQGLTSPQFRGHLLETRGKQGWFHRFTNLVKELLGIGERVKGTAFEEFLSHTDQLMQQGEYAAGFSNFAERFYKNLGFSDTLAQGQTQRALGLLINSGYGLTKPDIFTALENPTPIKSGEFVRANRGMIQMLQEKGGDFIAHSKVMDELGFTTDIRGLNDFVYSALNHDVSNPSDALIMLPQQAADYVFAKLKDYRDVLASVKAAASERNKGFLNLAQPREIRNVIGEAYNEITSLLKEQSVNEAGAEIVRNLQAITPDAFLNSVTNNVSRAPQWIKDLIPGSEKERIGPIKWFLGTAAQFSRSDPITAEYFDKGYELSKNAREMHRNITKVMGVDLNGDKSVMTKDGLERSVKAINTPKLLRAVHQWIYWNNEMARREKRGVTMLPDSHPEVSKVLSGLSAKEKSDVTDTVVKAGVMTRVGQAEELNKMSQVAITRAAKIAMIDRQLKPSEAVTLSDTLFKAIDTDRTNPQLAQQADAQISSVQQRMTPDGFLDLLRFTQNEVSKLQLWRDSYEQNPNWATARRLERWLIEYKRGNRLIQDQGSSRKEVLDKAQGATIVKQPWDQYEGKDDTYVPPTLSEETFQRMQQLEQNQLDILRRRGVAQETLDEIQKFGLTTQLAREQAANVGAIPGFQTPPRLLSKGADVIPWLWNHISHMERMSNYWTRQLFRAQSDLHLGSPELQDRPDLVSLLKDHRDAFLSPDPKIVRDVTKFTTAWFMGLNPASAMINGFQTITTLVPELTNITGKPIDSYRRLVSAISDVTKNGLSKEWGDSETSQFMTAATKAGERDFSMWDEDSETQEAVATRWKQLMMKHKVQTLGQRAGTMLGNMTNVGLWMFKQVEKFNHDAALLAGFRLARERGMSFDDASQEAFRLNRAVNYGGGKVNRPVGLFAGQGDFPRSLALLGANMQGYNLGVVGQLARYLQKGFFRPTGLTPAEVYNARTASIQMLATQFALAGSLGMPFVAGILGVLDKAFPSLEANRHIRDWVSQLFQSDDDSGKILGDIALTGLPSMLGWDMQSRLSMGNLVPGVTEYNGFEPEQLLGPPVSLVSNFVNGFSRVAQGNPQGAENFVPPGLKKLTQLLVSGGKLKNYRGAPVIDPTPGETAGIALGFQPKRLSDFNAASKILKQSQDVANLRQGQFHQQQAEEVLKGNFGTVRQALLSRANDDKTYNPIEGVRAVARASEELSFPRDLRREGTLSASPLRQRLLQTLDINPSQASEMQRLDFRTGIEQRLGLPTRPSASDRQVAYLVDQLRAQQPNATRAELRQAAVQLVRRQRLQTLSPLEE